MDVCMVTSELPPTSGGVGYYVYNLSKRLVKLGHKVTIITCKRSAEQKEKEVVDGIFIHRVPFYPLYPFHASLLTLFINRLIRSIDHNFDVIHLHSPMPLPIKTSLPLLTTVHTPMLIDARYHEIFGLKSLFEKIQSAMIYPPLESELFKMSRKITAVSRAVALELKEYGLNPSSITVVRNGVDAHSFFPNTQKGNIELYVLYTGVLRARKGLFDLVQCASYVNKIRPGTKFYICGKGPFQNNMELAVKRMGLEKQVVFLGYTDREILIRMYQNAAIQVIPSHYEGLPTVLLEGMSCGLPVVATDIGGNNEVIDSGKNGFLVPPNCPKLMAESLLRLLDDSSTRETIGIAARKTILRNYTWDKVADKITECYKDVI
jgi:glycosyltransferase involved in cell wall biosynthesis